MLALSKPSLTSLMSTAAKKIAIIVGAGSKHDHDGESFLPPSVRYGLGGSLSLRFAAAGFHVVLLGRRKKVIDEVAALVVSAGGAATTIATDVTSDTSVKDAFDAAKLLGQIDVVVFNVAPSFPPGVDFTTLPSPHEVDPKYLTNSFDIGVSGCVRCANNIIPYMTAQGRGGGGKCSFLITGATMSLRGTKTFGALSPIKFALRSYAQSMYQRYSTDNIHVAHIIVDGVIDSPNTRKYEANLQLMDPMGIADAYVMLHEQPKTVWTQEIQLSAPLGDLGMRI